MRTFLQLASVAGLIAFSSGAVSAQELRARIPFAFATPGGAEMPAGTYSVARMDNNSAAPTYRVYNVETRQSVLAFAPHTVQRSETEKKYQPELTFRCASEQCAISGIFHTGSKYGSGMRVRLKNVDPTTQIAEIAIPFGE